MTLSTEVDEKYLKNAKKLPSDPFGEMVPNFFVSVTICGLAVENTKKVVQIAIGYPINKNREQDVYSSFIMKIER